MLLQNFEFGSPVQVEVFAFVLDCVWLSNNTRTSSHRKSGALQVPKALAYTYMHKPASQNLLYLFPSLSTVAVYLRAVVT